MTQMDILTSLEREREITLQLLSTQRKRRARAEYGPTRINNRDRIGLRTLMG
jgi:hypothetical protein